MNYVVEVFSIEKCIVSEYDRRGKKLVSYYKLASNEVIGEIREQEDPYSDNQYSFRVVKTPYRPSIYLENAIVECVDEIDKLVSNYKKVFPKRRKALIRIKKVNHERKEVKKCLS